MATFKNFIAIKLYFREPRPLFCEKILEMVSKAVYFVNRDPEWRVVLYQQWVGDPNPLLQGYGYLQEARAIPTPEPKDITYIEINSNQPHKDSHLQVGAARDAMKMMFPDSPMLISYTPAVKSKL